MSKNYDNWEKLVEAVLRREELRETAMSRSRSPSILSPRSSSFSSDSQVDEQAFIYDSERLLRPFGQEMISISKYVRLFLDQRTGKECYIVGARGLKISWGDTTVYWQWTSDAASRFPEVAELRNVWWLDIRGGINTRMLSPHTMYSALLVFKLAHPCFGLEQTNAIVRFVNSQSDEEVESRALTVHLQDVENVIGQTPVSRGDGWMEVEIGQFYNQEGDDGEVEGRLLETVHLKRGLIVEGIEFRPAFSKILHGPINILKKESRSGRGRGVIPKFWIFR